MTRSSSAKRGLDIKTGSDDVELPAKKIRKSTLEPQPPPPLSPSSPQKEEREKREEISINASPSALDELQRKKTQYEAESDKRRGLFQWDSPSILILDDVLCQNYAPSSEKTVSGKDRRDEFLRRLTFISALCTESVHHNKIHLILAEQTLLSSNSSSFFGQQLKLIRAHLDLVVFFPSDQKAIRNFSQNIATSNAYRKLKRIIELCTSDTLDNFSNKTLFDQRIPYPYLSLVLTKNSDKHFRFRETLFNLDDEQTVTFAPPAFIWAKDSDFPTSS